MSPTLALDDDGPVLACGAARAARDCAARSCRCWRASLDEGLAAEEAVERPRLHPAAGVVHLEPGWPDDVASALEAAGYLVARLAGPAPLLRRRQRRHADRRGG